MSLLKEIQDAAIDSNTDITTVLRKCLVLAARLKNEEFKKWIECELNGYPSKEHLPDYRIFDVNSFGNLAGVAGAVMNHTPIPPSCLPKEYRDLVSKHYELSPISASSQLLRSSAKKGGHFQTAWPADLIVIASREIYHGYSLIAAWREIPRGAIEALVDSVRNRVLSLVLQLESEAPDAGEASTNNPPLSQERLTQMFTMNIYGNVGNIASGSQNVSQTASIQVSQGDIGSLKQHLSSHGISPEDLAELDDAIKQDGPQTKGFGQQVSGWIGKMLAETGKGTWKIATTVAASLLAKALAVYYGLSSPE